MGATLSEHIPPRRRRTEIERAERAAARDARADHELEAERRQKWSGR